MARKFYMDTGDMVAGGFAVVSVAFAIAAIAGWIMNVVAIAHTINDPITGLFILRCLGVAVAPIGAILGWV